MNIKKSLFITIIFMFLIGGYVYGDVYGIYSEHYPGFNIKGDVNDSPQADLDTEDDGYITWWAGSLPLETLADDDCIEGEDAVRVSGVNQGWTYLLLYSAEGYEMADQWRTKDLSAYKYIRFSMRYYSYAVNDNSNSLYAPSFQFSYALPNESWEGSKVYMDTEHQSKPFLDGIKSDNNWYTVIMTTTEYREAYSTWTSTPDFSISRQFRFGLHSITTFYLDNFVLMEDVPSYIKVSTNNITVPYGLKKILTADAYDSSDSLSAINPPYWSVDGNGTVIQSKTYETFFTATGSDGSTSRVTASTEGITAGYCDITISSVTWASELEIFGDFARYGSVNIYKDNDSVCELSYDEVDVYKGDKSLKIAYTLDSDTSYVGMYIGEDGNASRDMSDFGLTTAVLSFWVKTSTDLVVSIRSTNITAGEELSKVKLSEYGITLDNTWQHVLIVLDDFKQREPNLDFSDIDIYSSIAVQNGVSGSGAFWIDDLKWMTTTSLADIFTTTVKKVSDNSVDGSGQLTWTIDSLPKDWVACDYYMDIDVLRYSHSAWGVQAYTDNEATDANPKYAGDGNPVGLVETEFKIDVLPLCWRISGSTFTDTNELDIVEINTVDGVKLSTGTGSSYYVWSWMKDRNTEDDPDTPSVNEAFVDGQDAVTIWNYDRGIQHSEGVFGWHQEPNNLYFGAKFSNAKTPRVYTTNKLIIELYTE